MTVCADVDPITDEGGFDDGRSPNKDVVGEFEGVVGKDSVESTRCQNSLNNLVNFRQKWGTIGNAPCFGNDPFTKHRVSSMGLRPYQKFMYWSRTM